MKQAVGIDPQTALGEAVRELKAQSSAADQVIELTTPKKPG
jgi:hypothetical protein